VDTHVWQIACRDYKQFLPKLHETKSITDTVYRVVGDFFRSHFQTRAGWAHSVLFTAHLPAFREHLPPHLWNLGKGETKPPVTTKVDGCKESTCKTEPLQKHQKIKLEPELHSQPSPAKKSRAKPIKKELAMVKLEDPTQPTKPKKRKRLSEMAVKKEST